jgi:hypothetical protein
MKQSERYDVENLCKLVMATRLLREVWVTDEPPAHVRNQIMTPLSTMVQALRMKVQSQVDDAKRFAQGVPS